MVEILNNSLYLAVGQPLGAVPTGPDDGLQYGIRVGGTFFHLPFEGYDLWHRALVGATHEDLVTIATRQGSLDDLDDNVAFFQEAGLLVAWHGPNPAVALASDLRLLSTGVGDGVDGADRTRYTILSRAGTPACTVDFLSYVFWSYCDGRNTVVQAADATAAHCQVPPDAVLERAGQLVPLLVRHALVFLDRVGDKR